MDSMPINPVDGLVVLAVLLSALLALFRGLVREVLSLISWTLAVFAGARFASVVKPFFSHYTDNEAIAGGLGGFVIFVIVLIILTIVSHYIAKSVRESAVSSVDRALGFAFGALRGFLVAALVYLGGTLIFTNEKSYPDWLTEARTEPALRHSSTWLVAQMPADLRADLDHSLRVAKKGEKADKDLTPEEKAAQEKKEKAEDDATLERLSNPQPGRIDGRVDGKVESKTDKVETK